ncbi:DUF4344 domain-containing metallopeptidase [Kitasatospora sp. NPDC054939]
MARSRRSSRGRGSGRDGGRLNGGEASAGRRDRRDRPGGRGSRAAAVLAAAAALAVLAAPVTASASSAATPPPGPGASSVRLSGQSSGQLPGQPADGRMVAAYANGVTEQDQQVQSFLEQHQVLEEVADYATSWVVLPQDVPLTAASCGEPNAHWSPVEQTITLCYEYLEEVLPIYADQHPEGTDAERADEVGQDLIGFTNAVVLHEFGHALVDLYQLPVTGREEDAVDQLAVLLLVSGGEQYTEYVEDVINARLGLAQAESEGELPADVLADEHSLSAQRFYNQLCWLVGYDPDTYAAEVRTPDNPEGVLPLERAERCDEEYAQMATSWNTLLEPYLRNA